MCSSDVPHVCIAIYPGVSDIWTQLRVNSAFMFGIPNMSDTSICLQGGAQAFFFAAGCIKGRKCVWNSGGLFMISSFTSGQRSRRRFTSWLGRCEHFVFMPCMSKVYAIDDSPLSWLSSCLHM